MTIVQKMRHQSERRSAISPKFGERLMLQKNKENKKRGWDTFKYWGWRKKKTSPSFNSRSLFLSRPTFLPLTRLIWNWKTHVRKGGIYMGSHALIKTFPGTVCMHACMHVCASLWMCVCVPRLTDHSMSLPSTHQFTDTWQSSVQQSHGHRIDHTSFPSADTNTWKHTGQTPNTQRISKRTDVKF